MVYFMENPNMDDLGGSPIYGSHDMGTSWENPGDFDIMGVTQHGGRGDMMGRFSGQKHGEYP